MSMDGMLEVFDQQAVAFTRELNHMFLYPGPMCYVAETDCIVVCNSSMEVDCYKYSLLSSDGISKAGFKAFFSEAGRARDEPMGARP